MKHWHVATVHNYMPGKQYYSDDIAVVATEEEAEKLADFYTKEYDDNERAHGRQPGFYAAGYYACDKDCPR